MMKQLQHLLDGLSIKRIYGDPAIAIAALAIDSREVSEGTLFMAQKGTLTDGHLYIEKAITSGAKAILCETLPTDLKEGICYIEATNTQILAGPIASAFYDHPSRGMKVVGVTGTNGKTTVATLLHGLFTALGYHCGLLSTVRNMIGEQGVPATHTTPDPISLQKLLREMADQGCAYAFMEVSSHAIHQHRTDGIFFTGGIFTNITHDHLDYHKTFDEYINVKKSFFDHLDKTAFALTNVDDKRGNVMLQNTSALRKTYSLKNPADFKGKIVSDTLDGIEMNIDKIDVHFRLSGHFNAYNILAVYGSACLMGIDKVEALSALSNLQGPAGRFETYRSPIQHILGIIDYAHTPDALLNVLATIKKAEGGHQILTVVGCGGDRDKSKRPVMAQVACELSDKVILTTDNPRSEDPEKILDDMEAGLGVAQKRKTLRITDRKEAIKTACLLAGTGDVLLIAGKGHETYQEVMGVRHHFDDKETLLETFRLLEK